MKETDSRKSVPYYGDTGVDNFAAVANNVGAKPFLVKGGAVKSMNQWFNKQRAKLLSDLTKGQDSSHSEKNSNRLNALSRKRDFFLRDFFYKVAHYICRTAQELNIQVIVIGHTKGQKQVISVMLTTRILYLFLSRNFFTS